MTVSEDLNLGEQGGEAEDVASPYPVVFGITFTPTIIGIIVASLGLLGGIYMLLNMVLPAWDTYQQQVQKSNDLQGEIDQKKLQSRQIEKVQQNLAQAKVQQTEVLSLFANEKNLHTLLIDTNRLVESGNNPLVVSQSKAKLKKFVPVGDKPEIISDSSFGELVNNKLKRSTFNVEMVGTFEQTQSIMRNIERLQPLLIVKNYESKLDPLEASENNARSGRRTLVSPPRTITTTFQLQALMPLTPEEAAKAAQTAKAKK